uniref:Uncharacterized protein n=1 Tax=Arundo donax TaxID=35708 RepID=A0A0A8ZTM5_ARUDO
MKMVCPKFCAVFDSCLMHCALSSFLVTVITILVSYRLIKNVSFI